MNSNLHKAKKAKNDEFYTQSEDIENELKNYRSHFKGKKVFCNCDDPKESNFFQFFAKNFEFFGLEKLTTTHFRDDQPTYKLIVDRQLDVNKDGKINEDDAISYKLSQNGDFRSDEAIAILEESDIVVTNPPFSLFREYINQLFEYDKKFIIIGNNNALGWSDVFPRIRDNEMWLGVNSNKTLKFRVPDSYKGTVESDGKKYGSVPAISWFTNIDHKRRHEDIVIHKPYNSSNYPKYDNYDAIEVSRVENIPVDYDGLMGVPITFLVKYNPKQFEIVGLGQGNLFKELDSDGLSAAFVDLYYEQGNTGVIKENHPMLGFVGADGKAKVPYSRIIIRKR